MSPLDKICMLTQKLKEADRQYYHINQPLMTDDEYDRAKRELENLEAEFPDYVQPDSPSLRVGYLETTETPLFTKTPHTFPMLSLKNALTEKEGDVYNFDEITAWWNDVKPSAVTVDYKYDGLAIALRYVNGVLKAALTRGDGQTGEDVTINANRCNGVLWHLDATPLKGQTVEVRGEMLLFKQDFEAINQELVANGQRPYSTCRNAAAGIMRAIASPYIGRLQFVAYEVYNHETRTRTFSGQAYNQKEPPRRVENLEDLLTYFKHVESVRNLIPFDIDGLVYKIDCEDPEKEYGFKTRYPVFMIAHKFPPTEVETTVLGIRNQVGRTGEITPVADIEPVNLGVTVTSPTLNNYNWLWERRIAVGARVVVRRAGDVIPEIARSLLVGEYVRPEPPVCCPSCGGPLEIINNYSGLRCMNTGRCPAQLSRLIQHFVSRKAMNIMDFGEVLSEQLVRLGYVKTLADIYRLSVAHIALALGVPSIEAKSVQNIMRNIERSKDVTEERFLFALGIEGIGEVTAQKLCELLGGVREVMSATTQELAALPDIAEITATKISRQFMVREEEVFRLLSDVRLIRKQPPVSGKLSGRVWVVTGSFGEQSATDAKALLIANGAKVGSSVTRETTDLLVGEAPGSKLAKAESLGVPLWSMEKLKAYLGE